MRIKKAVITGITLLMATIAISAQESQDNATTATSETNILTGKNRIKLNVTALALKNLSLSYERVLKSNITAAVTVRAMPYTSVPFRSFVSNQVSDEHSDLKEGISSLVAQSISVTPELRIYLNSYKGASGWYLAPFYRYTYAKMQEQSMLFTNNLGGDVTASINGTFAAHSGGLVFGKQIGITRRLSLDLWFGPVVGGGKAKLKGLTNESLSDQDIRDIKSEISSWSYPLMKRETSISIRDVGVQYTGLSLGVNTGISLGFCF